MLRTRKPRPVERFEVSREMDQHSEINLFEHQQEEKPVLRQDRLLMPDGLFARYSLWSEATVLRGLNVMAWALAWQPNSNV
jgi:hypothetical protein